MKFNTIAEAFNFYRNKSVEDMEKRAQEINQAIDTDPNADVEAFNIELRGIKEAKENIDLRSAKTFTKVTGADMGTGVADVEDHATTKEYRSAFYKRLLGRELNANESKAWDMVQAEHRSDNYSTVSEVAGVIPTETLNQIIVKARTIGGLMPKCRAFAMPAKVRVPVATPGANASWNTEGSAVESDEPTIAYVDFGNNEIIKVLSISASVKKMSIDAFESYLVDELTATIMGTVANGIVNGDNSTYPVKGLASITWTTGTNAKEWSGTSDALTYADIIGTIALLKRGYANGAVFAMNNKTLYNSVYGLVDSNKRPIFIADTQNDKVGKLLGFEVVVDDNIADDELYFGNFNYLGYNFVDGIAVEASTQSSFKSGRIDYRGMAIADVQVLVAEAFVKCYKPEADA